MIWQSKKLRDALLPIFIANWVAGLGIVEYPLGRPRIFISLIYMIILISAYFYMPISLRTVACDFITAKTPALFLLYTLFTYDGIIFILSITIFWYYQESMKVCIRRIELIDETLECLGAKDSLNKIHRQAFWRLTVYLIGLFIPFVVNVICYSELMNFKRGLYYSIRFNAPIFLMAIINLFFETIVRCIGYSMENINFLLENAVKKNSMLNKNFEINCKHHRLIVMMMSVEFSPQTPEKTKNLIQLLKQLHLELSKVAWNICEIFGLQISMGTVEHILIFILYAHYTIRVILNMTNFNRKSFLSVSFTTTSILALFARSLSVNNICGQVAKKAIKAKEILYELKKGDENVKLTEEIEQFAMQISHRPLTFSMCGLFTLENKFFAGVLATTVTYLICIIQIGAEQK